MPSIRLAKELDKQLEELSLNTGMTKSNHIIKAITTYLSEYDSAVLQGEKTKGTPKTYPSLKENNYHQVAKIINMVNEGNFWTKDPEKTGKAPTPGMYGLNKIKGFNINEAGSVSVVSVYLSPTFNSNVTKYIHDFTELSIWEDYMIPVPCS